MSRYAACVWIVVALVGCAEPPKPAFPKKDVPRKEFTLGEGAEGPRPQVLFETSMGDIKIELFQSKAPVTVENFLKYVDDKHYDGVIFHRVIPDFMVQTGGFDPGMKERKTRAPIYNESSNGIPNKRGTLAMARTSAPHSASSQFFINVSDKNSFLDKEEAKDGWGYCVFGRVIEGMDVVDKIRVVPTGSVGGHDDVPREDVFIKSARRIDAAKQPEAKQEEKKQEPKKEEAKKEAK